MQRRVQCKLSYYHPGVSNEKYQIQVPVDYESRVPASWSLKSHSKACE